MLKKPELPDGFQQNIFKGQVREGSPGCVISSCTILRVADGEVAGRCHGG